MQQRAARAALSLSVIAGAGVVACANDIFIGRFDNHHYYLNLTPMTWADANTYAGGFGYGRLLEISYAAEQAFIDDAVAAIPAATHDLWMGLTALANPGGGPGAFTTWQSGDPVTFFNWAADAVYDDPARIFVAFNWTDAGLWRTFTLDGQPSGLKLSVIEFVPAPGTPGLAALLAGGSLARRRRS